MSTRLFTTRTHGVLDYLTAGALITLPRALGWGRGTTRLLTAAGLGTLAYSLLTRYELGLFKVLPMRAHLALDIASGATLMAAPMFLADESTDTAALVMGLGMFEIAAALTTEPWPDYDPDGAAITRADVEALGRSAREVMRGGAVGG